jgi:hypothetical protein
VLLAYASGKARIIYRFNSLYALLLAEALVVELRFLYISCEKGYLCLKSQVTSV